MSRRRKAVHVLVHNWKRLLVLLLLLGAAVLAARSESLFGELDDLLAALQTLIIRRPGWGVVVFILFSALSAMFAFLSSAVLVPIGVYVWGATLTFVLLWVGWLLGGVTAYAIGRYLGRRVVVWLVDPDKLRRYEGRLSKQARFPVVLLFQLALPSEIPGYLLGLLRYPFWLYVAALAIAELPFAAGAVSLGKSFLRRDWTALAAVGIAGITLTAWAVTAWHRRRATVPQD
ncbi:MAG: VTT domain-containing protein [Thermoanaerobaculia bacterium]|nr:VTT domain-containing protein [Thermoanaerobaculia bacterium]